MDADHRRLSGSELRLLIRNGRFRGTTAGAAVKYVQANLVVVENPVADEFEAFCRSNPKPCPLLERLPPGDPRPRLLARESDIRTDLPLYRVYHGGEMVAEVADICDYWNEGLTGFLTGCSFTFEKRLSAAGIGLRHIERGCNVSMYQTSIECEPAGPFKGPMVVSMRPVAMDRVADAVAITAAVPQVHGAPVHTGAPEAIGISDLERPDWGDQVPVEAGEVPVFWACGVTPQAVALATGLPVITHSPGHMFVSDLLEAYVDKAIPVPAG
ncbi:MAG: putative hydro-lyase [Chloroflexota bacterium]|nr:putative hydro-lyase [Chloroflexota bacterium]